MDIIDRNMTNRLYLYIEYICLLYFLTIYMNL